MSSDREPRIGAVALGVVVQDGHLLLEPMAKWLNVGLVWRPIGGYINFGERAAEAVVREFREELARDVEVIRLIEVYENLVTFPLSSGPLEVHETSFIHELLRTQAVNATASANFSDGVWKPSVCRGRPFSSSATASSCSCVTFARLVPFGKY